MVKSTKVTRVGGAGANAGGAAPAEGGKRKRKGKTKRAAFDLTTAVSADGKKITLDDKGRLTAVPSNWTPANAPLKRKAFATRSTYFAFRAAAIDGQIAKLNERKAEFTAKASGQPDTAKRRVKKALKIANQLKDLRAQLAAEGMDVDKLMAEAAKEEAANAPAAPAK